MIEHPPSIGSQMDALTDHLIESIDRVASDISHANARIDKLEARLKGTIVVALLFGVIFGALFSHVGKLLW